MISRSHTWLRLGNLALLSIISAGGYLVAYLLRFAGDLSSPAATTLHATIAFAVALKVAAAIWFRVPQGWSRYVTFHDLVQIAQASTCASIGLTLLDALALPSVLIPRSVLMLDWGASILLLSASRCLPRAIRDSDWSWSRGEASRALIVGVNDSGEALLREIRGRQKRIYDPIGFIDDGDRYVGRRIGGVPVLGGLADAAEIIAKHRVDEVLISSGGLAGKQVRSLMDCAGHAGARVNVLPSYEQLLQQQVQIQPRPVAIADLLRRPSIQLDDAGIRQWLQGRTVLVTGASGSIGSEICRQLLQLAPAKLLLLDRSETAQFFLERELRRLDPAAHLEVVMADINDAGRIRSVFQQYAPDVIFHAAAYKHVPLMESHPGEAVKNIIMATRRLADLAEEFAAEGFVMVSTDKAVNPTSVMGSCKRLAEQYVQALAANAKCRFVTVRFGNVLDSAGSVVPIFREQIAGGGPVTVTHPDMVRYFMLIPEAAQLVIQAGAMGAGGEIFVLDMGDPVRIVDLAADMIRLSGLRVGYDIDIHFTGLRPGEKLYEELQEDGDLHRDTAHSKILASARPARNLISVIQDIGRLNDCLDRSDEQLRATLADIIPLYSAP